MRARVPCPQWTATFGETFSLVSDVNFTSIRQAIAIVRGGRSKSLLTGSSDVEAANDVASGDECIERQSLVMSVMQST